MQARKVYACETCQPLHLEPGTELAPGRASALKASTPTKQFKSHCAPEAAAQAMPAQMTVKELKAALEGLQLHSKGSKAMLIGRLQEAQAAAGMSSHCRDNSLVIQLGMHFQGCTQCLGARLGRYKGCLLDALD